jgi:hypothetical protein
MSTVINSSFAGSYAYRQQRPALTKRFTSWCEAQQENRFLWLGLALAGHGCAVTPITLYFVFLAGMNFTLFMVALAAMAMALVVNLAALPTKITIPVLAFSIILDLVVIAASVGMVLNG